MAKLGEEQIRERLAALPEWNREGDTLLGVQCIKNKLTCRDVSGPYGYPKSLRALLGVELTSQEATVKGAPSMITVEPTILGSPP